MKAAFSFVIISLLILSAAKAQTPYPHYEPDQLKHALNVKLTDISGTIRAGKLIYGDSSGITMLSSENDSLYFIAPEQTLSIKLSKTHSYTKRLLRSAEITAGFLAVFIAEVHSHGDAIMISPVVTYLLLYNFLAAPVSFITAGIKAPTLNIDYHTYGKSENFSRVGTFLFVHSIDNKAKEFAVAPEIKAGPDALKQLTTNRINKGPEQSFFAHLDYFYQVRYNELSFYFSPEMNFLGFVEEITKSDWRAGQFIQVSLGSHPNYRFYLKWNPSYYTSVETYAGNNSHRLAFWYRQAHYGIGAQYFFKSVSRKNIRRKEYGLQAGLNISNLRIESEYKLNDSTYTYSPYEYRAFPGVHISTRGSYYFTPRLSITGSLYGNWYPKQLFGPLRFDFYGSTPDVTFDKIKIQGLNYGISLGLSLHI